MASPLVLSPIPQGRKERIRQAFLDLATQLGRDVTSKELADYVIARGILLDFEIRQLTRTAVQAVCRNALTAKDHAGLPWAGPTGATSAQIGPTWRQRDLWDYGIYDFNIAERFDGRNELHAEGVKLVGECLDRFGRAPVIPPLP